MSKRHSLVRQPAPALPHLRPMGVLMAILSFTALLNCSRKGEEPTVIRQMQTIATWAAGASYPVGALATFNGITYQCLQAHTSQVGWEPPNVPALWNRPGPQGVQPWQNQTAYVVGSGVAFGGLVYRCIQAHTSQSSWTPPATPNLWKVTGDVQIPPGLSGTLSFVFKSKSLPTGVADGFGLIQRDPFGDASFTDLLDTTQRSAGETFYRIAVHGGELFEFYLRANKTAASGTPSMTPATYSSDPTNNTGVDATFPDHVAQPLQSATQKANNIWSLRWESFNFKDSGRDGKFDDVVVELRLGPPCDNVTVTCPDANVAVLNHNASSVDYSGDFSIPVGATLAGLLSGPVPDFTAGEGNAMPMGTVALAGGRVDILRWSFVQETTDFSAATPAEVTSTLPGTPPNAAQIGGGLWSLELKRIHRPRAEAFVSSFGPAVFSNLDAKLTLVPNGIGSQNTVVLFDPQSDAPPITFFELSQQDGDGAVDGRYHDVATRTYSSLVLLNSAGSAEPNPFNAKTAVATRQSGEQIKFEVINIQGSTSATELQGRLTTIQDRNGNPATITYQFAASATTTALGGDRRKLWLINKVTDPHGNAATFAYQLRTGTSRWVVTSIGLPDATGLTYQYGTDTNNLDRLTKVLFANGDASTFSRSFNSASQTWALTFNEAVGADVRTGKTVYLSAATFKTPDNVVHNQEPNLVRRIVNNDGEQVYQATEDPNDPSTTYFRLGANKITRLRLDSTGLPREVALATTVSADPRLATYSLMAGYTGDLLGMIQTAADAAGNVRSFLRDSKTRAILSVIARGGTTTSFTLNSFLLPTKTVDRIGQTTTVSYDVKGNALTIARAVGTPAQAASTYVYSSRGQVTRATDPNGNVTDYTYSAAGFLTSIISPPDAPGGVRPVRNFQLTPIGRLSTFIDASGRKVSFAYDSRGRLTTTTFADGTTEARTYGANAAAGLIISKKDRNGVVEQYQYDQTRRLTATVHAAGRPEETVDGIEYLPGTNRHLAEVRAGQRTEFAYDVRQRPTSTTVFVTGSKSLTSQMAWDELDRPSSSTDPYGRRAFNVFDINDRNIRTVRELVPGGVPAGADIATLARVSDPNPPYVIEDTAYDAMNHVTATTDARGFIVTDVFDGQGRRIETVQAAGTSAARRTQYTYDAAGNVLKETLPRTFAEGTTFQNVHTYTGRNLLATTTEAAGSAVAATTTYTYTPTGQIATKTDPRGGATSSTYDVNDRLISEKDPGAFTTTLGYDGNGNRVSTTNALGATTTSVFDGLNRVISRTDPLGHVTTYDYDDDLTDGAGLDDIYTTLIQALGFGPGARGRATRSTNAAGESTVSVSDGSGRAVLAINANGDATTTLYDNVVGGLLETTTTQPAGNSSKVRQDSAGAARSTIDGEGRVSTFAFDPAGNRASERDPNGNGRDCQYDAFGEQTSCTDTHGDTTLWVFDAAGNRTLSTDAVGVTLACAYDARNRKSTCTDGVGAVTKFTYDGNSNTASVTDGEGRATQYTYDARNLQTSVTLPDSTGPTDRVTFTYDGAGRRVTSTDQAGNTLTYAYDLADRLTKKTDPEGKVDSYTYDAANRLLVGTSGRYGTTITNSYDGAGRLVSESVAVTALEANYPVSYSYDANNRVSSMLYPDGKAANRTYTVRNQLATIALGSQSIAQYNYDAGRRLTSSSLGNGLVESRTYRSDNSLGIISTPSVGDVTFTYDGDKRKLSEAGPSSSGAQSFTYDGQGRVTAWSRDSDTQSWSLSAVGDWQSTTRNDAQETRTHSAAHALAAVNGSPLIYDSRGNLTSDDGNNSLTWDFDNRITSYTPNGGPKVTYLYDVLGRRVVRTVDSTSTVFVHAGQEVVAEYQGGALGTRYVLGAALDKPAAMVTNTGTYWFSSNQLGSVVALTDSAGAVIERYKYDAYGNRTILTPDGAVRSSSAVGNRTGFTGRDHDGLTGLIDFRSRQYSPRFGRFVSRDDGYHDGLSLYGAAFVPNSQDPSGHAVLTSALFASAFGGRRTSPLDGSAFAAMSAAGLALDTHFTSGFGGRTSRLDGSVIAALSAGGLALDTHSPLQTAEVHGCYQWLGFITAAVPLAIGATAYTVCTDPMLWLQIDLTLMRVGGPIYSDVQRTKPPSAQEEWAYTYGDCKTGLWTARADFTGRHLPPIMQFDFFDRRQSFLQLDCPPPPDPTPAGDMPSQPPRKRVTEDEGPGPAGSVVVVYGAGPEGSGEFECSGNSCDELCEAYDWPYVYHVPCSDVPDGT